MHEDLKAIAIAVGNAVYAAKQGLVRDATDNQSWKDLLKERCLAGIREGLTAQVADDVSIRFVETPYNTKAQGRGAGRNEMSVRHWGAVNELRTLTVLADIVDGSWNAACGLPWSASTMVALTAITSNPRAVDDLMLHDFKCSLIVPIVGGALIPPAQAGFYYGAEGERPRYRLVGAEVAGGASDQPLHCVELDDVQKTRFFLDLFTAETFDSLSLAIDAVKPLIRDWGDIGRFYGAGMELMSLLGPPGVTPGFGGYVAASQKADNLIPTKMLLEGAGAIVTDWWGGGIERMKIMDRAYVAIAATRQLHEHLVRYLSRATGLR